ncbi:YgfZ/GcvT domain-containing protein [Salsipaludibacter albus]|uniref:CAF17-like 4Fe-4S cluster assembly/insertion protein YgfZ n=1 Tax=Salsipaludibacter albus TaxID=2849650 RepID=UPI001EE3B9ED|nr:hypothetical protein [Salsipaludibacter albus]MBY5161114.1 hypothetical protein [Salsipaludibacter albus]
MLEAAPSDLVVIDVTGADRTSHLDAVTTQRFTGVDPGTVLGALVLSAKGAPLVAAWALVDEDRVVLLAPPEAADHVTDELARRTFLADVTFTRREDLPVTALASSSEPDLLDPVAGPADTWHAVESPAGEVLVVHHAFGVELVGTDDPTVVAGDRPVRTVDLDELRIRRGEPRWGHEVVAGRLPEEYGLLPTHVHLSKGCYPGQEPIAHMWMLGRPRRRLAVVAGSAADDGGDEVTGSAGGVALAFVKADTRVGDVLADDLAVASFVGQDRDPVGWTPAQTRRRDRDDGTDRPGRRP